jgi:DNA repair protein RecN (Recombination protein N)
VLQELRIQRLGVIDDAVLELHPGLNVVSGETGAGKTMVVTGLGLLLGARADTGLVRTGAGSAVVEGLVAVPPDHPAALRAADAGADTSDGLVLVRTLSAEGRSRAHVGGRTAPVGVLAEIGEHLVAVHGQADQWRLRQPDQHRSMLDQFGGEPVGAALRAHTEAFDAHAAALAELTSLRAQARERAREIEVLQHGQTALEQVDPQPGEDADLRVEDERLSHAEGLRGAAEAAHASLAGLEEYAGEPAPSAMDTIAAARQALAAEADHDPRLKELDRRLAEVGYLVADLAADLSSYLTDVEVDPARLVFVQQRRADLTALTRKYGDTIDEVLEWGRQSALRLGALLGSDSRIGELEHEVSRLATELGTAAATLTGARTAAAAELATRTTAELAHLAMGQAVVTVAVSERGELSRHGADTVEIQLAANPGSPARSVAKAASGGELSRVMLALEVVSGAAGAADVPTFVFDEVDAGVGGAAALDVGARLAALAEHAQVVVVTHLAQVAAYADRHHVVRKASDGHITSSGVHPVEGEERLRELARMMAGVDSDSSLDHARELVAEAAARRVGAAAS